MFNFFKKKKEIVEIIKQRDTSHEFKIIVTHNCGNRVRFDIRMLSKSPKCPKCKQVVDISDNLKKVISKLEADRDFTYFTVLKAGSNLNAWVPQLSSEEVQNALIMAKLYKIHHLVTEASRIADEIIERKYVGKRIMTFSTVETGSETKLTKAIDHVLEVSPNNPHFLFAKSEGHYARMDGETGIEYRNKTLKVAPDHFDANMLKNHYEQWDHLFSYPVWSEQTKIVPNIMLALQADGESVQIVRDGLIPTIAILIPTLREQFPFSAIDLKWKPLWVETPHGPIFIHYVILKLRSGDIHRQELIISPYPIEPIHPRTGHWLIRRFCEVDSIFIGFNDKENVIYNSRCIFSKTLLTTLSTIKSKLYKMRLPRDYDTKFKLAAQWYMQNSNLDDIAW